MIQTGEAGSWQFWDVNILYYFVYSYLGPLSLWMVGGATAFLGYTLLRLKTVVKGERLELTRDILRLRMDLEKLNQNVTKSIEGTKELKEEMTKHNNNVDNFYEAWRKYWWFK